MRRPARYLLAGITLAATLALAFIAVTARSRIDTAPDGGFAAFQDPPPLPREWVWRKVAVELDDMFRKAR